MGGFSPSFCFLVIRIISNVHLTDIWDGSISFISPIPSLCYATYFKCFPFSLLNLQGDSWGSKVSMLNRCSHIGYTLYLSGSSTPCIAIEVQYRLLVWNCCQGALHLSLPIECHRFCQLKLQFRVREIYFYKGTMQHPCIYYTCIQELNE